MTPTQADRPPAERRHLPPTVIDTNCVLDLWVFQDPGSAALREALHTNRVRWLATPAMRTELARVLQYPQIARHLSPHGPSADEILAAFDRCATLTEPAARAPVRCRDPDDQCFIDLAVAHHAQLISKDTHVTGLARRLAPLGVNVCKSWTAPQPDDQMHSIDA